MSVENAGKFEKLLRSDEGLQAELKAAAEAYEGDSDDARAIFDATLGKVAGGMGLAFTYEEALAALASARELAEAELDALVGGGSCFVFGGSDGKEAECEGSMGHACSYIGVTF